MRKKYIVYLNNFMDDEIINIRNNKKIYSQPANNKINGIKDSLNKNNCDVDIISSGLVNNKSFRYYKTFKSTKTNNLIYSGIVDLPIINTISSIIITYLNIIRLNKRKRVDNIIFYNYKPEVAWAAYLARIIKKIPITVEYEDGYTAVENIGKIKGLLFRKTEEVISKHIDSAILVTSKLREKIKVKNVVVRGVINEEFYNECINRQRNKEIGRRIKVLYSGGLDRERGIDVLLSSLKYINSDFEMIITGKGNLENKVKECNDKRVKFLGFISYEEMKNNMINSNILVNCQLEKHIFSEVSFPSKVFEYIATGNIVISSHVSDIDEFAGDTFYFYSNDNEKELGRVIERVIQDYKEGNSVYIEKIHRLCNENLPESIGKKIIDIL